MLSEAVGGAEIVEQMAAAGDGEAQYSRGCELMSKAGGYTGYMGAAGRSPIADVGLVLATYSYTFRVAHRQSGTVYDLRLIL